MKKNVILIAYFVKLGIVAFVVSGMGYDMFTWQYWFLIFEVIFSYLLGRIYKDDKEPGTVKAKNLSHDDLSTLNDTISIFISDKNVVDIKYQSLVIPYELDKN